jgi:hypothetical protein
MTPTVSDTATASPTVSASPTPASGGSPAVFCGSDGGAPATIAAARIGLDEPLAVSTHTERLPDNMPLKPQRLDQVQFTGEVEKGASVVFGLDATVPTSQHATVCGVTAKLVSFQPLTAPIPNIYIGCKGQFYSDPGGWNPSTACPGLPLAPAVGSVAFTSTSPGATASGIVTDPSQQTPTPAVLPYPVQAPYGQYAVLIGVQVPQPGTYTFSFGLWQDRSGPRYSGPSIAAEPIFTSALHEWSGAACTAAAMQSQLPPPSNPPAEIICPGPVEPY